MRDLLLRSRPLRLAAVVGALLSAAGCQRPSQADRPSAAAGSPAEGTAGPALAGTSPAPAIPATSPAAPEPAAPGTGSSAAAPGPAAAEPAQTSPAHPAAPAAAVAAGVDESKAARRTPAVPPPSTPSGLAAAARSASVVGLSWQPSSGPTPAVAYEVRRGAAVVATVAETHAAEAGLRSWTRYCYTVRALDASGARSPASPEACATTLDEQPPTVPGGVTAVARPDGRIQLGWQPSTDDVEVVGYEVARGSERLGLATGTSFTDARVSPAREYCYTVLAVDHVGNRSVPSSPACAAIPDTTPPSVPAQLVARAPGETEVRLSWAPSTDDVGVVRYQVFRSELDRAPIVATREEAVETGLEVNTRRCYQVRACDASGNCSDRSAGACATTPDLTPPSVPALVTAKALGDGEVEIAWVASRDNVRVAGYEVFRAGRQLSRVGEATSFRDDGLEPAIRYCYQVRAVDWAGNRSASSAQACATTPDLTPPTTPPNPAAVPVSTSEVFLAWDPSTDDVGVVGYEVLRGDAVVASVRATRARESGLAASAEYCYRIRAFDAAWNRSPPTAPVCARTTRPHDLGAPSEVRARRTSPNTVTLQWEPSEKPGVLYRIYAKGKLAGITGNHTFTPSGRLGAESNCYQIVVVEPDGRESPKSREICTRLDGQAQ